MSAPVRIDRGQARLGSTSRPSPPRRRWILRSIAILTALLVVFYGAGGWMFANEIESGALEIDPPGDPTYDVGVVAVVADEVTLRAGTSDNEHVTAPGIRGIESPGGAGFVTAVTASTDDTVDRGFVLFAGSEPLTPGLEVDLHPYVLPSDPAELGLSYEEIMYPTPLGPMAALHFSSTGDDWAIFVHGRSAPSREAFRLVAPVVEAGMHALVIEYRNDPGAPTDPSGFYRYGATEWEDVEAAVRHAVAAGAGDVVLVGYSMGGGIVISFAFESDMAAAVDAIVLDAGMVDLGATIDFRAEDRTLPLIGVPVPQSLTDVAKWIAGMRHGIDWGGLDYAARVDELSIPVLAFHGTSDDSVPITPIREMAAERPDLITLIEVEGAGHVLSWNVDPEAYEAAVLTFVANQVDSQ